MRCPASSLLLLAASAATTPIVLLHSAEVAPSAVAERQAPRTASPAEPWLELGRSIFEQYAPPEIRAQFELPSPEQWAAFATRLERALEGESLGELAALAEDTRTALALLRTVPGYEDLADWLERRLDEIEGAGQAVSPRKPVVPAPQPPLRPGTPLPGAFEPVPYYNLWLQRVRNRPPPAKARELLPRLQAVFAAERVPPELVWLAEAESSFNPTATSPAGAKGLFQFMPATAKTMGLQTFLPDERTNPEKAAQAAARYLRSLHSRFGNWALALAAYNAGEGRVSRALAAKKAKTFTAIAETLPAETRMYVPKVCALVATRAGVPPERIAPPR